MPLKYNPTDAIRCLQKGDYPASLESVEDKISSTNKPMQKVTWRVYAPNGIEVLVTDYIVCPDTLWKLKQVARALHKEAEFDAQAFQLDDNTGANVVLELDIKSSEQYGDQNTVKKVKAVDKPYSASKPAGAPSTYAGMQRKQEPPPTNPVSDTPQFKEDDIPF